MLSINATVAGAQIFGPVAVFTRVGGISDAIKTINDKIGIVGCIDSLNKDASETFIQNVLRTRIDDGRHGTGAFWATSSAATEGQAAATQRRMRDGVRVLYVEDDISGISDCGVGRTG